MKDLPNEDPLTELCLKSSNLYFENKIVEKYDEQLKTGRSYIQQQYTDYLTNGLEYFYIDLAMYDLDARMILMEELVEKFEYIMYTHNNCAISGNARILPKISKNNGTTTIVLPNLTIVEPGSHGDVAKVNYKYLTTCQMYQLKNNNFNKYHSPKLSMSEPFYMAENNASCNNSNFNISNLSRYTTNKKTTQFVIFLTKCFEYEVRSLQQQFMWYND
jgi:hypothetical protein